MGFTSPGRLHPRSWWLMSGRHHQERRVGVNRPVARDQTHGAATHGPSLLGSTRVDVGGCGRSQRLDGLMVRRRSETARSVGAMETRIARQRQAVTRRRGDRSNWRRRAVPSARHSRRRGDQKAAFPTRYDRGGVWLQEAGVGRSRNTCAPDFQPRRATRRT